MILVKRMNRENSSSAPPRTRQSTKHGNVAHTSRNKCIGLDIVIGERNRCNRVHVFIWYFMIEFWLSMNVYLVLFSLTFWLVFMLWLDRGVNGFDTGNAIVQFIGSVWKYVNTIMKFQFYVIGLDVKSLDRCLNGKHMQMYNDICSLMTDDTYSFMHCASQW